MSLQLVTAIKNQLLAQGVDLAGPCGAFAITKRVAWALRSTGAGLLSKRSGNHCDGYATDILCYPTGQIRDILGDGGGANTPLWSEDLEDAEDGIRDVAPSRGLGDVYKRQLLASIPDAAAE